MDITQDQVNFLNFCKETFPGFDWTVAHSKKGVCYTGVNKDGFQIDLDTTGDAESLKGLFESSGLSQFKDVLCGIAEGVVNEIERGEE